MHTRASAGNRSVFLACVVHPEMYAITLSRPAFASDVAEGGLRDRHAGPWRG